MSDARQKYFIQIDNPATARGADEALSYQGLTAASLGEEIQVALREDRLYARWRALQEDPDDVDPRLGEVDVEATVVVENAGSRADLVIETSLSHALIKHRLNMLIGDHWHLHDVRSA